MYPLPGYFKIFPPHLSNDVWINIKTLQETSILHNIETLSLKGYVEFKPLENIHHQNTTSHIM